VRLGEREAGVLFSVLDRVARAAGHSDVAAPVGTRVARAGASFRTRLDGGSALRGGLAAAAASLPGPTSGRTANTLPPELRRSSQTCLQEVTIPCDALLDLAAELLEVADVLIDAGHPVEALALEGVSGRLLELVVGAGPHEGTPLGTWR
jgi:hypothetical protein